MSEETVQWILLGYLLVLVLLTAYRVDKLWRGEREEERELPFAPSRAEREAALTRRIAILERFSARKGSMDATDN